MLLLVTSAGSYAQLITVLILFVIVLGITAFTTKWIANYQKQQGVKENIQVIDTVRIANNKYVQIIRVGGKYMVIAICKDTVTMLGEVLKEELIMDEAFSVEAKDAGKESSQKFSFQEFLDRASGSRKNGAARDRKSVV